MARVPYLEESDLPAEYRDLLKRRINLTRALAHSPNAARRMWDMGRFIRIVDLIVTIGFYNGVVRVLAALQIDVEDDYLKYLDKFPPPG